ncbi:hypothetical protein DV452_001523 [Geotrichum candidum]|nr:hypothetical protein DV452_001523 [Geotrichum candidum]KAI8133341.1 hypothetical protein DUD61_003002 [Geotrichum candidum]KAI9213371.1 hypothetical protein DS838_001710 [Geotrichum bryndzae]
MVVGVSRGIALFKRFGFITFLVAFLAAVVHLGLPPTSPAQQAAQCDSLLHRGRWLNNHTIIPTTWQPDGCALQHYNQAYLNKCMKKPNSNIIFMGDSTARQLFWETAHMLDPTLKADFNVHGNAKFTRSKDNITVHLFWDPYLNRKESMGVISKIANGTRLTNDGPTTILYVTAGLWHAMFHKPREKIQISFETAIDNFVEVIRNAKPGAFEAVYFAPTQLPQYFRLDLWRKKNITKKVLDKMYAYTEKIFDYNYETDTGSGIIYSNDKHRRPLIYYFPAMNRLGANKNSLYDRLGLHLTWPLVTVQVDLLYNHFCNRNIQDVLPPTTTCCVTYDRTNRERLAVMGWVALVAIATAVAARRPSSAIKLAAWVGIACLYSFMCERTTWIPNETRAFVGWIESFLLFQVAVTAIVLSIANSAPTKSNNNHHLAGGDDDSHNSTGNTGTLVDTAERLYFDEWKGLLMVAWLLLAYTGLDDYSYYYLRIVKSVIESTLLYIEIRSFAVALTATATTAPATVALLVRRLINVALLPMLLALTLKVDLYQAYRTLPIKFGMWYVITAVVIRLLHLVLGASLSTHQSRRELSIKIAKVVLSGAAFLGITGFILSELWMPSFFDKEEVLRTIRSDFFVPLVAINVVVWSRMSASVIGYGGGNSKNLTLKKRYLAIGLFLSLAIVGNYLVFINPGGGHGRATVIHVVTFYFIFFYTVILRPASDAITAKSLNASQKSSTPRFYYSRFLAYWGPCWVQLLVLSQHILLTKNGHVKIHLIPTSLASFRMSAVSQTINYIIVFALYGIVARNITRLLPTQDVVPESLVSNKSNNFGARDGTGVTHNLDNNDGFDINEDDYDLDMEAQQKLPLTLTVTSDPSIKSQPTSPGGSSRTTRSSFDDDVVKQE